MVTVIFCTIGPARPDTDTNKKRGKNRNASRNMKL